QGPRRQHRTADRWGKVLRSVPVRLVHLRERAAPRLPLGPVGSPQPDLARQGVVDSGGEGLTRSAPELTTVADDEAVIHDAAGARVYDDLAPDEHHEIGGFAFRTLPRLGERL